MNIVQKLRELRRLRGLSQKEAAESSGMGVKTLSSFETGERIAAIKVTQLLQILAAYDMTPGEFFADGVERQLVAESVDATEMRILAALRALPESSRTSIAAEILRMIAGASSPSRLRAIQ